MQEDFNHANRDNRGWTPIHLAAKNGHLEALELLIQHSPLKETCEIIDDEHVSEIMYHRLTLSTTSPPANSPVSCVR